MIAKLIPGYAPEIGSLPADRAQPGRSLHRRWFDVVEFLQLLVGVADRIADLGQARGTRAQCQQRQTRGRDDPHPLIDPGRAQSVVKDEEEDRGDEDRHAGKEQSGGGMLDVATADRPRTAVESVVGGQQRIGNEGDRDRRGDRQPRPPQAVRADREGDDAAQHQADQHPPRLSEEGEAENENSGREGRGAGRRGRAAAGGETAEGPEAEGEQRRRPVAIADGRVESARQEQAVGIEEETNQGDDRNRGDADRETGAEPVPPRPSGTSAYRQRPESRVEAGASRLFPGQSGALRPGRREQNVEGEDPDRDGRDGEGGIAAKPPATDQQLRQQKRDREDRQRYPVAQVEGAIPPARDKQQQPDQGDRQDLCQVAGG